MLKLNNFGGYRHSIKCGINFAESLGLKFKGSITVTLIKLIATPTYSTTQAHMLTTPTSLTILRVPFEI
jgi:hypothetical protein